MNKNIKTINIKDYPELYGIEQYYIENYDFIKDLNNKFLDPSLNLKIDNIRLVDDKPLTFGHVNNPQILKNKALDSQFDLLQAFSKSNVECVNYSLQLITYQIRYQGKDSLTVCVESIDSACIIFDLDNGTLKAELNSGNSTENWYFNETWGEDKRAEESIKMFKFLTEFFINGIKALKDNPNLVEEKLEAYKSTNPSKDIKNLINNNTPLN